MSEQPEQPFSPLVGAVLTQMFSDSQFTTNALIDSYKTQLLAAYAELYAIREGISALLYGPYAPSSRAIKAAVFTPDLDLVAEGRRLAAEELP